MRPRGASRNFTEKVSEKERGRRRVAAFLVASSLINILGNKAIIAGHSLDLHFPASFAFLF